MSTTDKRAAALRLLLADCSNLEVERVLMGAGYTVMLAPITRDMIRKTLEDAAGHPISDSTLQLIEQSAAGEAYRAYARAMNTKIKTLERERNDASLGALANHTTRLPRR